MDFGSGKPEGGLSGSSWGLLRNQRDTEEPQLGMEGLGLREFTAVLPLIQSILSASPGLSGSLGKEDLMLRLPTSRAILVQVTSVGCAPRRNVQGSEGSGMKQGPV